jgi:hypothetical protein
MPRKIVCTVAGFALFLGEPLPFGADAISFALLVRF